MEPHKGVFSTHRPRRLRSTAALRDFVAESNLRNARLVLPFFARPGKKLRKPVTSMPDVFQLSPDQVLRDAEGAFKKGVRAVLLLGILVDKVKYVWCAFLVLSILQY